MSDKNLNQMLDFINNFDKKDVKVAFLFVHGKAGSVLLQSLIDGNEQVLCIPTCFGFYYQWECYFKNLESNELLVDTFFDCLLNIHKMGGILEGKKSPEFLEIIKNNLLKILKALPEVTRKTFFLAVHCAYAFANNIDLEKVKTILHHHHYYHDIAICGLDYYLSMNKDDFLLKNISSDFPNRKFLISIRHPFDSYNSTVDYCRRTNYYQGVLWGQLIMYPKELHYALVLKKLLGDNLLFVKFEELHKQTEFVMREVAEFLGVDFCPQMLESSFDGELWYGNNPEYHFNGTNPNRKIDTWKKALDYRSKVLCMNLFNSLCEKYGYEPYTEIKNDKKYHELTVSEEEFLNASFFDFVLDEPVSNIKVNKLLSIKVQAFIEIIKKAFIKKDLAYLKNISKIKVAYNQRIDHLNMRYKYVDFHVKLAEKLSTFDSYKDYAEFWLTEV